jgi:hypothetical protein
MSHTEDFAELRFRIECNQMVLSKAGGTPLVVRGPGEIWQDVDGTLQYKIFTDQLGYRGLQEYMGQPGVVGQLIPDDEFFSLEVYEYNTPQWTARRIIPSSRGNLHEGVAYGYLQELVQTRAVPENRQHDHVHLRLRGKHHFPCNQDTQTQIRVGGQLRRMASSLNAAFIEDGDYRFEVLHEKEHTVISMQIPAGQLTPATPSRIHEALQFVLGQQLAVMVVETSSCGQNVTRLTSPSRGHGKMSPPLHFDKLDQGGHFWRLYVNYFRHINSNTDPDWHPISSHIGRVIESTSASLETEILALGVAVEGLVGECFPGLAPASPDFLADLDSVQTALRGLTLGDQSRTRISGSLGSMSSPRNSDVLRAFIAKNRLPNGLYDSWRRLRNASAHGDGTGGRDIAIILRLKSEVLSLLYSIVFAAINYAGPRTDYSQLEWPTQTWPLPIPETAAPEPVAPAPAAGPTPVPPPAVVPPTPDTPTTARVPQTQLPAHPPAPPSPPVATPTPQGNNPA